MGDKVLIGFAPPGVVTTGPLTLSASPLALGMPEEEALAPLIQQGWRFVEATIERVVAEGK